MLGWLAVEWLPHGQYYVAPGRNLWDLLFHWDALWFARIVTHGYSFVPGEQSAVAFFPLLPACAWGLRALTGMRTALAGCCVANVALLGAALLLRRLVALDFPEPSRVPERSVWLLLLSPMTFFHSAFYSESLFLVLSLAALLCARQQRWAGAALSGALATATRGNALVLLLPLIWEACIVSGKDPSSNLTRSRWCLLMVPVGLLAYGTYLHVRFGDALAFAHTQAAFHRELAAPWEGLEIASRYPSPYGAFFIGTVTVALVLCGLAYRGRLRPSYQLYAVSMLLLCLSTTLWESLPRYLSVVFPFYVALAAGTIRSEASYTFVLAASTGMMAICLALFAGGYFMT